MSMRRTKRMLAVLAATSAAVGSTCASPQATGGVVLRGNDVVLPGKETAFIPWRLPAREAPAWPEDCECARRSRDGGEFSLSCVDAIMIDAGYDPVLDRRRSWQTGAPRRPPTIRDAGEQFLPFGFPPWGTAAEHLRGDWPDLDVVQTVHGGNESFLRHPIKLLVRGTPFREASFSFSDGGLSSLSFRLRAASIGKPRRSDFADVRAFLLSRLGEPSEVFGCGALWSTQAAWIEHTFLDVTFYEPARPRRSPNGGCFFVEQYPDAGEDRER